MEQRERRALIHWSSGLTLIRQEIVPPGDWRADELRKKELSLDPFVFVSTQINGNQSVRNNFR